MSFLVRSLPAEAFQELSTLTDHELAARGVQVHIADHQPGYPCRVALRDAELGERLFLLNYRHHDVEGPYRSSHAIFVLEGSVPASPEAGEVPEVLGTRLLSVRAFDQAGEMLGAEVAEGKAAAEVFERLLADPSVAYLHVHTAARGCFLARVVGLETLE